MTNAQELPLPLHPMGATPGIKPVYPSVQARTEKCELRIHIAPFFDGTGNNRDWDDHDPCHAGKGSQLFRRKESNVAKLFAAYPDDPPGGYYRTYIAGVGTPFAPIGEEEPAGSGMGSGGGGDGRINYGLLSVLNAIHKAASPVQLPAYRDEVMLALCRNGKRSVSNFHGTLVYGALAGGQQDVLALDAVGMREVGGLLMSNGNREHAKAFYRREAKRLGEIVKKASKPKPVEIFIDVFGFSRGGALARTFCSWLDELFDGDTLCGIKATIRFVGLFDTVASVGVPNQPVLTLGLTDGHYAWGNEAYLRVPARVANCVHFVAMHENRPSFPSDRVVLGNALPPNCQEFGFPGMHSDVGGGYGVNEQGRGQLAPGSSKDALSSEKLSQIPLEYMLKAAQAAGSPLDVDLAIRQGGEKGYDPFKVNDKLRQAYAQFHAACLPSARQPADWLITYLAWRYQVRNTYASLAWASRISAGASDKDDLEGANRTLLEDIQALDSNAVAVTASMLYDSGKTMLFVASPGTYRLAKSAGLLADSKSSKLRKLAPEAGAVLQRLKAHPAVSLDEAALFGTYAHDSYAGFRPFDHQAKLWLAGCQKILPGSWEPEGYLRYRRFYTGSNDAHTYAVEVPAWQQEQEAVQNMVNMKGYGVQDMFPAGGW